MINDSIARKRSADEQRLTERFCEGPNDVCFAEAFEMVKPQLLSLFRAGGFDPTLAEALAENVVRQLTASMPAILQRASIRDARESVLIRVGDLRLDVERRVFWRGNDEVHLSPKEFDLLAFMMKNAGFPLTHVKLLRSVWGIEYGGELEYLRTYVHMLRKKIEKVPANPEYIVNEPWIGYRFRCPNDQEPAGVQNR
jgi:DNA-binding winged helix-turn-helix (wHTH) protein